MHASDFNFDYSTATVFFSVLSYFNPYIPFIIGVLGMLCSVQKIHQKKRQIRIYCYITIFLSSNQ